MSELDTPEGIYQLLNYFPTHTVMPVYFDSGMKPWKLRQDTRKKVFDEGNALLEVQANMEVLVG